MALPVALLLVPLVRNHAHCQIRVDCHTDSAPGRNDSESNPTIHSDFYSTGSVNALTASHIDSGTGRLGSLAAVVVAASVALAGTSSSSRPKLTRPGRAASGDNWVSGSESPPAAVYADNDVT